MVAAPGERPRSTARRLLPCLRRPCPGPPPLLRTTHCTGERGGGNELSMSGVPGQPAGGQWSGARLVRESGRGREEGGDAKLSLGLNNPTLPSQLALGH